jgi:hypothetical protein
MTAATAASSPAARALALLGSMKLSVWLLLLLAALTWLGTLAQVGKSTHEVQREYFESWFVIAELPLSVWGQALYDRGDGTPWPLRIPLPGAYPVMALFCVNLIVGGLLRMKWSWRNAGILVTHVGIVLLLVAGAVKLHASYSGMLAVYEHPAAEGQRLANRQYEVANFISFHDYELALMVDRGDSIEERLVPESTLWAARGDGAVTLRADGLPFTVEVRHFVDHASVLPKGPMVQTRMPVVDGAFVRAESWPVGVQPKSEAEIPACYVTVRSDAGDRFEAILSGDPRVPKDRNRYPFPFTVRGQRYGLDLRAVVHDLPFSVRLDKFQKLDHPGTMSPRDFRSFVTVADAAGSQEAQIFMNNPLRRDGYVVYQTNWGPQPAGGPPWYSVFEVSWNPSDVWPAIACIVIWIGLFLHFGKKLLGFLDSSARASLNQ